MSGFGEYFKNEKRNNTLSFFRTFFNALFNKEGWYFIFFWIFLSASVYGVYKTLTVETKFPVECGKVIKTEIYKSANSGNTSFHLFIEVNNKMEDISVSDIIYEKYNTLLKTDKNTVYCESYTDKMFIFYIIVTVLLAIIAMCFLANSN